MSELSDALFNAEYLGRRPVILTEVATKWRAFGRWTPGFFEETLGEHEVYVVTDQTIGGEEGSQVSLTRRRKKINDYVRALGGGFEAAGYWNVYPIFDQFPCLRGDVDFPVFSGASRVEGCDFYFSGPGYAIPLHYDTMENLYAQVYGTKTVALIAPRYRAHCYPVNQNWLEGHSAVDIGRPDYQRFPLFREVEIHEVTLQPGEILYIPSRWWHAVRSDGPAINVNQWFYPDAFRDAHREQLSDQRALGIYDYPITPDMIVHRLG